MEKAWLRVSDIAKDLDMSEETVRAWIREGKLKGAKFGRVWHTDSPTRK